LTPQSSEQSETLIKIQAKVNPKDFGPRKYLIAGWRRQTPPVCVVIVYRQTFGTIDLKSILRYSLGRLAF
jgi:hypothetical protein